MNIFLVRHADPDYAADSLTPLGRQEAQKLGDYLRAIHFSHFYVSPMGRAQDTMAPSLDGRNLTPRVLPWLHELDGALRPDLWVWNVSAIQLAAEEGLAGRIEAFMAEQQQMVVRGWNELLAEHGYVWDGETYRVSEPRKTGVTIGIFAHAGLITTLLSGILKWPLAMTYAHLDYKPTAVTQLRMVHRGEQAALTTYSLNSRPHLYVEADLDTGG